MKYCVSDAVSQDEGLVSFLWSSILYKRVYEMVTVSFLLPIVNNCRRFPVRSSRQEPRCRLYVMAAYGASEDLFIATSNKTSITSMNL